MNIWCILWTIGYELSINFNPYNAQAYFQYGPIFAKFQFNRSQLHCLPLPASDLKELTTYQTM